MSGINYVVLLISQKDYELFHVIKLDAGFETTEDRRRRVDRR